MSDKQKRSWDQAAGSTFQQWMDSRVAHRSTRTYDWNALKFQTQVDPKYGRAQMRYIGTGGTGVSGDSNSVPAEHFTFSTMVLPAGHEGPLHIHYDVEEVFFVLRGKVKMIAESVDGKEKWEAIVHERDLISWPPGVYRGEINIGDEEALMLVMLGAAKPETPTYRPNDPLSKIKRPVKSTEAA